MPRRLMPLAYALGGSRPALVFSVAVLARFERYRQRRCLSREAGGQLFARYAREAIVIEVATGPYRRERRTRTSFLPDRKQEQQDVTAFFSQRLHFIGNWHTHPEPIPNPSSVDVANTRARFRQSDHLLKAFVLTIVGLDPFPAGLLVALIDSKHLIRLMPIAVSRRVCDAA